MPFVKNVWYMAGWADEVGRDAPLARTIAEMPLVFYRDGGGVITCLTDACPHRFVPLSRGAVEKGELVCPYHGLGFGEEGKCTRNPHGPITSALNANAFPVAERHSAIWVWLGDLGMADPAAIPPMDFIEAVAPEARVRGYLQTRANYMLMVENIMDLSHADYLHADTLGGGINTRTKGKVREENGAIAIRWHAIDDRLPPAQARFLPDGLTHGDFWNEVFWYAPGAMKQRVLFGPHGELERRGIDSWTLHNMTPETEGSTHYFFCHTNQLVSDDPSLAPVIRELLMKAFSMEDSPTLEAQQRRIGNRDFWSMKPALLPIDAGAGRVRRKVDEMLASEFAGDHA